MGSYVFDNGWERERERLAGIEGVYDSGTTRHLDALGVRPGWACLEVAGGGGSIAAWLCRRVGKSGKVVATDLDTRFLDALDEANLQVLCHDVVVDELPDQAFDLIHARLLLEHLPDRVAVLQRLRKALKPGGAMLIEDLDWRALFADPPIVTIHPESNVGPAVRVFRAMVDTMCDAGYSLDFGARLPALMVDAGLDDVSSEGRNHMYQGGTRDATVPRFTLTHLRDRMVEAGRVSADEVDAQIARFDNPGNMAAMVPMVSAWGRRPGRAAQTEAAIPALGRVNGGTRQLGQLAVFAGCSTDELTRIGSLAHMVGAERGQAIVEENQPGDLFYVVVRGRATVRSRRRKLATLGPGSFFGETALLTGGPRTATVTADTRMSLVALDRDAFDQMIHESPTFGRAVLEGVAQRVASNTTTTMWP